MAEEFTAKFKVDITDLKKNIDEANKAIRTANATFKSETAGMDKWSKDADGLSKKLEQLKTVLENQKTILSSYQSQLKKQQEAYSENGKRAAELKSKLQELASQGVAKTDAEYQKYEKSLKSCLKEQQNNEKAIDDLNLQIINQKGAVSQTEASIKKYSDAQNKLEKESKSLTNTVSDQEKKLSELKADYIDVVAAQGKNSDSAQELAKEIDSLSGELADNKKALKEAGDAADELDKSLEDIDPENSAQGFTVLKGALASLVADGIRMAIDAVKDFASETVNIGKEFDSSMSQVAAVSGATGKDLQALRDKAKEMGETTKFSASESADAFNYMAMAGWKTEDMLDGIEGVLNLAAASGSDLATTSDIVTDALTAMGYSAGDAGRLADVMAAASSNANTNVEMMGGTFKYAAPIIGAMGYSMEDAAVAIGLMANAGIKGEQAGTALRSTLSRLAAPPKECATAMDELGISITNADGTMKPLNQVIEELRGAFAGLSESQQTQYAKSIAGTEAMSGLLAVVNASDADFKKLTDAVNNSNGAAQEMADTMQDNLGGDLTKLGSQLEGVQIALYEKLEPALRKGAEAFSWLIDKFQWIIDHGETIMAVIIGVGTAVGTFLTIINKKAIMTAFLGMLTKIKTAFVSLNATMAANPIGLVVAAITGLIAAFVYLWNTSEDFRNFWIDLWEKIKNAASDAWEKIKEVWNVVSTWFNENVIEPIKTFFSDAWTTISGFFTDAWEKIKEVWESVATWFNGNIVQPIVKFFSDGWESIKGIWETVATWFDENVVQPIIEFFEPLLNWFDELFTSIWQSIESAFNVIAGLAEGCYNIIVRIWELLSGWFDENVIQPISEFFTELWDSISKAASDAWNSIVQVWQVVSNWFNQNIVQPVKNFFSQLWSRISGAASDAWTAIKTTWQTVSGWFEKNIVQPIKTAFSGAWSSLKKGASDAWTGIKNTFKSIPDWFKGKFKDAWQKVKDVFSTGGKIFTGIKDGIVSAFKKVVNAIIGGINKIIATPFNAINGILNKIRGISILGVEPFSGLWGKDPLKVPKIPELARGGILKRGQVGLLEGSGAEAVVPLENNKAWIQAVARDMLAQIRGLDGQNISNIANGGKSTVFTQIINAPKQPSRIELYRQTKNLLAMAEGGMI